MATSLLAPVMSMSPAHLAMAQSGTSSEQLPGVSDCDFLSPASSITGRREVETHFPCDLDFRVTRHPAPSAGGSTEFIQPLPVSAGGSGEPIIIHISWTCSQACPASCHAATCGCHAIYSSTTCACHDVPCSCHSAISSTTCSTFRSCISSTTCSCHVTTCSVGYGFYTAVWSCHVRTPLPLSTWSSSGPPLTQPPPLAPQSGS